MLRMATSGVNMYSQYVRPVCLPDKTEMFQGVTCTITGWGASHSGTLVVTPTLSLWLSRLQLMLSCPGYTVMKAGRSLAGGSEEFETYITGGYICRCTCLTAQTRPLAYNSLQGR